MSMNHLFIFKILIKLSLEIIGLMELDNKKIQITCYYSSYKKF